jgi:hypothetical protein
MSTIQERMNDEELELFVPSTIIDSPLTFGSTEAEIDAWIKILDGYEESPEKTKALTIAYKLKNSL